MLVLITCLPDFTLEFVVHPVAHNSIIKSVALLMVGVVVINMSKL